MRIKSIEVENYKSYWKPQKINAEIGFNLLVGANNSGKTTMLEALDLIPGKSAPHSSIKSLPNFGDRPNSLSKISVGIETDIYEMRRLLGNHFQILLPGTFRERLQHLTSPALEEAAWKKLQEHPVIELLFELHGDGSQHLRFSSCFGMAPGVSNRNDSPTLEALAIIYRDWDAEKPNVQITHVNLGANIDHIRQSYSKLIYRFSPQRRPSGQSGQTGQPELDREATNLPFCINYLQSREAHAHAKLCAWIHRIFPNVAWVQAPPIGNFQLQCLPLPPAAQREDLAVPMSEMGTGIGNVIAMLYVVMTARYPQVIAIDEPNSFLHPRALRELLQILALEGSQHQFFLTAHSADVLTAVDPSLITLFNFDGSATTTQQVPGTDISLLQSGLVELGIRMTDLHGRDKVLWVEGQTEEIVVPDLLRHFCPEIAAGTAVLRVEHTGAFEKAKLAPGEVAKAYERLTSFALVPPMVAVLLDSEMHNAAECKKLQEKSGGILRYLDETMLENYLFIPDAIAAVLNELGEDVSSEQVAAALEKNKILVGEPKRGQKIHGANVLKATFADLVENRHEFRKTYHVPLIVRWALTHQPESLQKLGLFFRGLFSLPAEVSREFQ